MGGLKGVGRGGLAGRVRSGMARGGVQKGYGPRRGGSGAYT